MPPAPRALGHIGGFLLVFLLTGTFVSLAPLTAETRGGDVPQSRLRPPSSQAPLAPTDSLVEPPQTARDVLQALEARNGAPLPGYIGGRVFLNRERRLPRGRYREYDVNPKGQGQRRGGERIVIEQQTQKAYYTPDHYQSFLPLN